MKQFFKFLFASILGFFISIILILVVIIGIASAVSSESSETNISENSVLYLNLNQIIAERSTDNFMDKLPIIGKGEAKNIGFYDVIKAIRAAKTDDKIKGIYINISSPQAGLATLQELRAAIEDFKSSKKFIIAYSEAYNLSAYYIASAADQIYLTPSGEIDFKGMSSINMFFKNAMDKFGIEAQIIRVGKFKSAVEPFFLNKMSDASKEQASVYLNGIHRNLLRDISVDRKISLDSLMAISNQMKIRSAKDALHFKFVDGLLYKDEILSLLKKKSGIEEKKSLRTVSINDYAKTLTDNDEDGDKIAVIYANGEIAEGKGNDNVIGSDRISEAIRAARTNEHIKAIVLRVNSPGGSALASDIIWREMVMAKKVKPVIVSMGNYAASGGYYIACAADSIFAQPNTITGSIGVFGIIPNFKKLLNDKVGITFDGVKTGEFSDMGNTTRPLTDMEKSILQTHVNEFYADFIHKVAEGRHKTDAEIDSIASGRVWIGNDALKIGLVDKLGSFEDAIKAAAHKAKLKKYKVVDYPSLINPIEDILKNGEDNIKVKIMQEELGDSYIYYQKIKQLQQQKGIMARMPFGEEIQY